MSIMNGWRFKVQLISAFYTLDWLLDIYSPLRNLAESFVECKTLIFRE